MVSAQMEAPLGSLMVLVLISIDGDATGSERKQQYVPSRTGANLAVPCNTRPSSIALQRHHLNVGLGRPTPVSLLATTPFCSLSQAYPPHVHDALADSPGESW